MPVTASPLSTMPDDVGATAGHAATMLGSPPAKLSASWARWPVNADMEGVGAEEGDGGDRKSGIVDALVVAMVSSTLPGDATVAVPERDRLPQSSRELWRAGRVLELERLNGERGTGERAGEVRDEPRTPSMLGKEGGVE